MSKIEKAGILIFAFSAMDLFGAAYVQPTQATIAPMALVIGFAMFVWGRK